MPRISHNSNRGASGGGSIRKKIVRNNGKEYTYWEARYTAGFDPKTGKQRQRSISGKTQREVAQKLRQVTAEIDLGTWKEPCELTVSQWLDLWLKDYLLPGAKKRTADSYRSIVENHLKPAFGAIRLADLPPYMVQQFYNGLRVPTKKGVEPLSAKTIRNINGVLHECMQQAVELGYIKANPTTPCKLPKVEKPEIKPLNSEEISRFLKAIRGHAFEAVYLVALFTGMRQGEVLGLTWDCIHFDQGTITINKQLQRERGSGRYHLVTTKNSKARYITPAPTVMRVLDAQRVWQEGWKETVGPAWEDRSGLVFTNELGHNLSPQTVYLHFKKFAREIGCPDARFHDLRHSYAVAAIRSGDDIKTVQETLGHHSAAFTLDIYAHVTAEMRQASSTRMEQFIQGVSTP